ncbi:MAG: EamA family transporter [Clostridium sp.]|uniref:EamA family transporter n=1 Tax=Clostridium sp. TaxID=1506 RepID=UPI0030707750
MINILLAILCSSLIAIVFKFSEGRESNRYIVTNINYLSGMIASIIMMNSLDVFHFKWFSNFIIEGHNVFANGQLFSIEGTMALAIILGVGTGILYFLSFILYQKSVGENGVSVSATFMKLGVLIPTILSIILLGETIDILSAVGIIVSIIAIIVMNLGINNKTTKKNIKLDLIWLFILAGGGDFLTKLFQNFGMVEYKGLYLFYTFLTGFIISFTMMLINNRKVKFLDICFGVLVGIPNVLMPSFLIKGLEHVKAVIAFPLVSAGTILVTNFCGVIFFNEKLNRNEVIAIGLTIVAIVLMS